MKHISLVRLSTKNLGQNLIAKSSHYQISNSKTPIDFVRTFRSSVILSAENTGILGKLKTLWKGKEEKPEETPKQTETPKQAPEPSAKNEQLSFEKLGEEAGLFLLFKKTHKEKAKSVDPSEQKKLEESINSGKFDLNDFKTQLKQLSKMGGIAGMLKYMPAGQAVKQAINQAQSMINKDDINAQIRIIDAMTEDERKNPSILMSKAFKTKQRISQTANVTLEDVNRLLAKYEQTAQMMKMMYEMKKKGQPLPNSMEDIMKLMLKNKGVNV